LFPTHPAAAALPGYRLILASSGPPESVSLDLLHTAALFDRHLSAINRELADKLASHRLAPTTAQLLRYDTLASRLTPSTSPPDRPWDSQLKLLPLPPTRWEALP